MKESRMERLKGWKEGSKDGQTATKQDKEEDKSDKGRQEETKIEKRTNNKLDKRLKR